MGGAVLMITITDRSRGKEFAAWFQRQGIPLILTVFGRGTATTEMLDFLGTLGDSEEKEMLAFLRGVQFGKRMGAGTAVAG